MDHSQTFPNRMLSSAFGVMYDLKHWKKLPPQQRGEGTGQTLSWILTRSERFTYVLLWTVSLSLLVLLAVCLSVACKKPPPALSPGGGFPIGGFPGGGFPGGMYAAPPPPPAAAPVYVYSSMPPPLPPHSVAPGHCVPGGTVV